MNSYLPPDEAHTQTHRSTGRIHHQPDRKQRKPHAQTPISVTNAAKLAPLRGCGALRGDKTHDGSCRQQAFDEAPSQDLLHRGTDCDSGATVTLFSQRAQPRHRIQRHPCLSLMHTVLYTNENAAKMALPRTHWHRQVLTA